MSALQPDDRQEGRSESAGVAIFGGQVASSDKTVLSRGMSAAAGLRPACIVLYVNEQLARVQIPVFYYSSNESEVEIDFAVQTESRVIPIEVKAEENVKSKSLSRR